MQTVATGGNPSTEFHIQGTQVWAIGVNNTSDDRFELGVDAVGSGTPALTASASTRNVDMSVSLSVAGTSQTTGMPRGISVIDFSSSALGDCTDKTITVSGAATDGEVLLGVPDISVAVGSQYFAWVSAVDSVTIRHCCVGAVTCDPDTGTFSARVINP